MNVQPLLMLAIRATLLLALTLALLPVARRASATVRRCSILCGLCGVLALPLFALPIPGRPAVRVPASALTLRVFGEALSAPPPPLALRGVAHAPVSRSASARLSLATLAIVLWALGTLIVTARAVWGLVLAQRLVRRSGAELAGARSCPAIDAPAVVGLFRPVILLPRAAAHWPADRLYAVMVHESAHARRRDGLALFTAHCACALYWFQPLVWLAAERLRRECELCADEDVILDGMRPTAYAEHLIAIARSVALPAGAIGMAARPSELGRRIQTLLSRLQPARQLTRARTLLILTIALLVLALVACTRAVPQSANAAARTRATNIHSEPNVDGAPGPATSVHPALQRIAEEEAAKVHEEWGAQRVAIIVLEPKRGLILASTDDAPGRAIVPASTLKPLTVAVALDGALITPEQRFDCGNGERAYGAAHLRDAGNYGSLSTAEILAVSSNIGVSRIYDVLGAARLADGLRRFGVGAPPDIGSSSLHGAIVAIGEGSTTSPAALAAAYGVLANDGLLPDAPGAPPVRIIRAATALAVRSMLEGAVTSDRATGKGASVAGVRVGGKTGTSDDPDCAMCAHAPGVFASFVGIVPIDQPRWVVYVGVGQPNKPGSGGTIAAPVFARIASRALALP